MTFIFQVDGARRPSGCSPEQAASQLVSCIQVHSGVDLEGRDLTQRCVRCHIPVLAVCYYVAVTVWLNHDRNNAYPLPSLCFRLYLSMQMLTCSFRVNLSTIWVTILPVSVLPYGFAKISNIVQIFGSRSAGRRTSSLCGKYSGFWVLSIEATMNITSPSGTDIGWRYSSTNILVCLLARKS